MSDIFIAPKVNRRKTKEEMNQEEYIKTCERMAELRSKKKQPVKKEDKQVEKVIEKIVEKPIEKIVEKIVEKPVEKIVEKIVEKPIEVIKYIERPKEEVKQEEVKQEVIKQEVVKPKKAISLFESSPDDLRFELMEVKKQLSELNNNFKKQEQPKVEQQPQKFVWGGVYNGFKPY